jgi:hypothetical protein
MESLLAKIKAELLSILAQLKSMETEYLWDTPSNARHSVRVICDEEGLTVSEKNLICAVVMAESGFKNQAKCLNKNKEGVVTSTDWGVAQINDFYHIGKGLTFPSIQYVLEHPDKVIRWMIKMYRLGHLDWWIAYKNGSYKKYLSQEYAKSLA